jgi:drug/metabolite transporter (DMT)-like permease
MSPPSSSSVAATTGEPLSKVLPAFAGIYIIWGTTFLCIALAIQTIPAFFSGAARFALAGALMYLWLRWREPRPFSGLNIGGSILCGVLLTGIGNGFVVWAELALPSGVAALFISALPVLVLLLNWAYFTRRAPTLAATIGGTLGLAGVLVLTLNSHALSSTVRPIHVIAILTAVLGWALGTLLQRRYVKADRVVNYSCLQMLAGAGFQGLMGVLNREWVGFSPRAVSLTSLLALLYLVVFGSIIAVNCYSYLLAHVAAQKVATYALVNPVIALALGALVLHERITPAAVVAAVLVLAGVGIVLFQGGPAAGPTRKPELKPSHRQIEQAIRARLP